MSDPTITVTNLGEAGVESTFAVIYPPQVAIVGFGRVAPRAVGGGGRGDGRADRGGEPAADHRVSDGHRGAPSWPSWRARLQEPEKL